MTTDDEKMRQRVLDLLFDGYGVEDIALMVTRKVSEVRWHVKELRASGALCKAFQVQE